MRILILDTSPVRRGAPVFASELGDYLLALGNQVSRVYLFQPKNQEMVSLGNYDRVFPFQEDNWLEKIPSFQPKLLLELKKKIWEYNPEIILCNGSKTLKYGAWLRFLGWSGKAKVIGRFIDDAIFWNPLGFKKWMYSVWINRLDGIIGVSQHSLNSVLQHYSFKKSSTVIYRTFDLRKFKNALNRSETRQKLGLEEQDEVLLFLGNLTQQKRPDKFIEIIFQLTKSRPKLKALIVGDGVLRNELEKKLKFTSSKQLEASDSSVSGPPLFVSFMGYQQDVAPYLAVADILVLPSDTEGLPGVILEAAYFGVPTIATAVGGIQECLLDGETGILVPDRSVEGFCERINSLLANPEFRVQMGLKSKFFVSEKFKMDVIAKQYLNFFSSLLQENS